MRGARRRNGQKATVAGASNNARPGSVQSSRREGGAIGQSQVAVVTAVLVSLVTGTNSKLKSGSA
jgi:hypothetical protein